MNWLAFHLASGLSLFSGTASVALGMLLLGTVQGRWLRLVGRLFVTLGTLFVLLSSTPWPQWVYGAILMAVVGWSVAEMTSAPRWRTTKRLSRGILAGGCLLLAVVELPHLFLPKLPTTRYTRLVVIGDSISAGIDDRIPNWPQVLARQQKLAVVNLAKPGATLSAARKQVSLVPPGDGLLLLEIGGNDLLGNPNRQEFERDLRGLLASVRALDSDRTVVMLELPLLPLQADYGRLQRRLAAEHGVYLVPKRFLTRVLASPDATIDGLHLTAKGNEQMARMIVETLGTVFATETAR